MKHIIKNEKTQRIILGMVAIVIFLVIWQMKAFIDGEGTVGPVQVFRYIFSHLTLVIGQNTLIGHVLWSLSRVLIGFGIAAVLGITLALLMSQFQTVDAIASPIFNMLRPIPPIGWIPLAILWFGVAEKSKYFIIFVGAFVPFVMNTYTGAKRVDPKLIDAALMLGISPGKIFSKITFPAIVPQIFAGAQLALTNAWMSVIGAELVRSDNGAGWVIMKGMENADMEQILSGMIMIGITGFLIVTIMRVLEKYLIRWNVRGG